MDEVLKFLKENPIFYIATTDGTTPKVRPFGFIMKHENKLYFCTNNQKEIYKQLQANPLLEICTTASNGSKWLRLKGKAVFDNENVEAKKACFVEAPFLSSMYGSHENPKFSVFYIADGVAEFSSITGDKSTVNI